MKAMSIWLCPRLGVILIKAASILGPHEIVQHIQGPYHKFIVSIANYDFKGYNSKSSILIKSAARDVKVS